MNFKASAVIAIMIAAGAFGQTTTPQPVSCSDLPMYADVKAALTAVQSGMNGPNSGLGFPMWASLVNRDGAVCVVTFSGTDRGDQWPGSRVISAQKANTANAFSLPGFALSTANLYAATQPGGTLYGLQASNPVDTTVAYGGDATTFGTSSDPMMNKVIGGVNVFGGGLALYNSTGKLVGGLGVSGDTSCTDHIIAWKLRWKLKLDYVPAGIGGDNKDNMINPSGVAGGHPDCDTLATGLAGALPTQFPTSTKAPSPTTPTDTTPAQ